jgi:acyl-CoA synthetase (AMP-forming)/AMP-acid ligase II
MVFGKTCKLIPALTMWSGSTTGHSTPRSVSIRCATSNSFWPTSAAGAVSGRILELPDYRPELIESLQFAMISGSPIEMAVKQRLIAEWPSRIVDYYGTTEAGGIATLDLKTNSGKLDAVGRIMEGVEPAILDESDRLPPVGEIGEIAAITPMPMKGYYSRHLPERTIEYGHIVLHPKPVVGILIERSFAGGLPVRRVERNRLVAILLGEPDAAIEIAVFDIAAPENDQARL